METFIAFWYTSAPKRFLNACRSAIASFDSTIAVRTTWKNIGRPLFQDYTWQGRVIGFFLRLFRVIGGLFLYAGTWAVFGLAFILWICFPAICAISLVGGIIGPRP